jgi:hypothetical protein
MYGAMGFVFGLIFGVLYGLGIILFGAMMMGSAGKDAGMAGGGAIVMGIIMMIAIPIIYGIMMFIAGAIGALLYNLFAGMVGGIEINVENV